MNYRDILDFWFAEPKKWFNGWEDFGQEIKKRFEDEYKDVIAWKLDIWMDNAFWSLALIIILDQFPRNMFRGTARAFEYDFKALYTTKMSLKKWFLEALEWQQRNFLLMPLMHSESLPDQDILIEIFEQIDSQWQSKEYAKRHRDIIVKFGRFPHRNLALGRISTPAELDFIATHSNF